MITSTTPPDEDTQRREAIVHAVRGPPASVVKFIKCQSGTQSGGSIAVDGAKFGNSACNEIGR